MGHKSEIEAILRKRNQLTLPPGAVSALRLEEGDVVVIDVKGDVATLRPVRRSYAGALAGVYGDAQRYVERERSTWE
ncbi:MAG TPA: AbrB/MazE/SpoVT family DNA-binding domain-containing protein [Candidatus Tyrphobacter sp.]